MLATFDYTLCREDDEYVIEVTYDATIYRGMDGEGDDCDIDVMEITHDGEDFDVTPDECDKIYKACLARVETDYGDAADDEADYRYELSREFD